MIIAVHTFGERATCRTVYDVVCDVCGARHSEPGNLPEHSIHAAQRSGWHLPSLFPGESFDGVQVHCPNCRMRSRS